MNVLDSVSSHRPPDQSYPLVSVILPTYGDAEYLGTALQSIDDQSYPSIEVVIIDGSNVDHLARLGERSDWINYRSQKPSGVSEARNKGIDEANGEMIAFLDADDYWHEDRLSKQVPLIQDGADIIYADEYVLEAGSRRYHRSIPIEDPEKHWIDYFRTGADVPIRTVLVRSVCLETHRFNTELDAREDPHLWVRLFRDFVPARVSEPLAYKRIRSDSLTADRTFIFENEIRSVRHLSERYPELRKHFERRMQRTRYRYGKDQIRNGNRRVARQVMARMIKDGKTDPRIMVLYLLSLLPVGSIPLLDLLERING